MKLRTITLALIGCSILSCTKVTEQDTLQGTLSPKGTVGMLGFAKDQEGNYLILLKQNNLYDHYEMRLSKNNSSGEFITDKVIFGSESKDEGKTTWGAPGKPGSGRIAYNPDKNEISIFSCYSAVGHQYGYYNIISNNAANFGESIKWYSGGNLVYSHNFDQRTIYNRPTKQFYQLSHGDEFPRAMGMHTSNTDSKDNCFWRYLVRPAGGGNRTHTRIGDLSVFYNGTVAATASTPFYDNNFINSFLPSSLIPCYANRIDSPNLKAKMWQAAIDEKYPINVILSVIPYKSSTLVRDGALGVTPDGINVSGYEKASNLAGAISKVAVFGTKILVAWLTYKNYNYDHAGDLDRTVFCIYDTTTKTITRKDSVAGAKLFHTVSILADPVNKNKAKWITPNETELVYNELDVATFEASGFQAAYKSKSIPLNINEATTTKAISGRSSGQLGPLGWFGSNPEIDYIMNDDGSMDIIWMNLNAVTKMYGQNFYPLLVTSIDNNGEFKKVITVQVRAVK